MDYRVRTMDCRSHCRALVALRGSHDMPFFSRYLSIHVDALRFVADECN